MSKIITGAVVLLLVIVVATMTVFYIDSQHMCGNEIYAEYLSPDKAYKAVVFQRDCGATTGFSTQISILEADEVLGNSKGNIYIVDGHPKQAAPNVHWHSENKLTIKKALYGSEYKAESSWGGRNKVKIVYGH